MSQSVASGAACGGVRSLLRAEGCILAIASIALYAHFGGGWRLFALLILVPDLSMLFYLAGPRVGALAYNAAHSTAGPIALATAGYLLGVAPWIPVALIWTAHIGVDRALGYGLKYSTAFGDTHLGLIGRARRLA